MNINNLKKVALHGARLVNTDSSHIAVHSALQKPYGFGRPPTIETSDKFTPASESLADPGLREFRDDPANLSAVRSVLALTSLDQQIHVATLDSSLSPSGRQEKLFAPRVAAIKTIAQAGAELTSHGTKLAQRESDFYQPDKLPLGDAQAASEDKELRDHWRSSPTSKRAQMLGQMQSGNHERMLRALTRSPIPLETHEAELVNTLWHGAVDRREPAKAAELQSSRANVDWATSTVRAAATYATRSSGLSGIDITNAAAKTGGEHLFDNTNAVHAAA
jgi:hypothetical protein